MRLLCVGMFRREEIAFAVDYTTGYERTDSCFGGSKILALSLGIGTLSGERKQIDRLHVCWVDRGIVG